MLILFYCVSSTGTCAPHDVHVGTGWARTWQGVSESQESHVWEEWSPQKMWVERERDTLIFLDVTDPLDFKRLISVGNPSKMINVFCWSTFSYLVSSAWVKISEITIHFYGSSSTVHHGITHSGFSVLSDRWVLLFPFSQKGKGEGWCFQKSYILVCVASQLRAKNSEFEPSQQLSSRSEVSDENSALVSSLTYSKQRLSVVNYCDFVTNWVPRAAAWAVCQALADSCSTGSPAALSFQTVL